MDVGSFVFDALGERWAMDLGMQEYESLESKGVLLWDKAQHGQRWEVLRYNNRYHNTLTFDNKLQVVEAKSEIIKNTSEPNFMSAVADLSPIYTNSVAKALRGIAIVNKDIVVVRDEIKNNKEASVMQWSIVTPSSIKILDGNVIELSQNNKKCICV